MNDPKLVEVFNTLIQINNDRIEGYETASNETDEQDLQSVFSSLAKTSHHCKKDLSTELIRLGGTPTESTKITGKFFRVWMDVKAALTSKDRKGILNSCEYGEDAALATYSEVLKENDLLLSIDQKKMIKGQYDLLRMDHDHVKMMRDNIHISSL